MIKLLKLRYVRAKAAGIVTVVQTGSITIDDRKYLVRCPLALPGQTVAKGQPIGRRS